MNGRTTQDVTEAEGSAPLLTHEPVLSISQLHGLFTESPSECIPAASKCTFIVKSFHQNFVLRKNIRNFSGKPVEGNQIEERGEGRMVLVGSFLEEVSCDGVQTRGSAARQFC